MAILSILIENHESRLPNDRWAAYVAAMRKLCKGHGIIYLDEVVPSCSFFGPVRFAGAWVFKAADEAVANLITEARAIAGPFGPDTLSLAVDHETTSGLRFNTSQKKWVGNPCR